MLNRDDIYHDLQAATAQPDRPAHLRIVYVATLAANETLDDRKTAATKIAGQCSKTLTDIAAKISEEYYFTLDDGVYWVAAGPSSVRTYHRNLAKRLLEAFSNLNWMLLNGYQRDLVVREFRIYERLFVSLIELGVNEVRLAQEAYRR